MKSGNSPTLETESGTKLFQLHLRDARELADCVKEYTQQTSLIDVTITSPPYHDIIDYDSGENQVGFGQDYGEYKEDLGFVFKNIFNLTKKSGSLWLIVDTYSKDKKLVPMPFELITKIVEQGWILKNIFIWKKDKTRPWVQKGHLRKIYEYILFFVKSQDFKFYVDRIRELNLDDYKEWWVKYPERYNPKGKIPTNIWEYPIPVQGSWRQKGINHSNPLPVGLIHRILSLVTDENDVVCDPFSGTGTVLAAANAMDRRYLGFELNETYVENFSSNIKELVKDEVQRIQSKYPDYYDMQTRLSNLILDLRLVKFPKSVFKTMVNSNILDNNALQKLNTIFVIKLESAPEPIDFNRILLASENLYFIFKDESPNFGINEITKLQDKREINRFQIFGNYFFSTIDEIKSDPFFDEADGLWLYNSGITHKYDKKISLDEWIDECKGEDWAKNFYNYLPPIISNVKVDQKVRQTWMSREEIEWLEKEQFEDILNDEWELIN